MSCRACGAAVKWVKTRQGKALPVEPAPDNNGNVVAMRTSRGTFVDGHVIPVGQPIPDGYTRFYPHFSSCSAPNLPGRPRKPRPRPPAPEPTLFDPVAQPEPPAPF